MNLNLNDPRNRPAEEGIGNDPGLRDESAAQPGASTISTSGSDYANQETTESVSDYPDTSDFDDDADEAFDTEDFEEGEEGGA